jgi:hypothetical protein
MADTPQGFSRVNFFTGFQTTADDWNHVIKYDVDKHRLHNRLFHGPGVVPNVGGGLVVSARGRSDMSVEVAPGYAVDGSGNDIFLGEPEIKTINPGDFKLPQTVYLVIKYIEELTDFVTYRANLEYKGHRRVAERVKVEAIITEPDIDREIELGRVHMTRGVKKLSDAKDPLNPGENEIDLRYVPQAGVVGTRLPMTVMREMSEILADGRDIYGHAFHNLGILSASDVLHSCITLDMMQRSGQLDTRNIYDLWSLIFDLQQNLVTDVEANQPQYSSKKEFASYKKHIELLSGMYAEGKFNLEFLTNIIGYQKKSNENLVIVFSAQVKAKKAEAPAMVATDAIWEKIKVKSDDFTELLEVDGLKFKRVDMIELLSKQSEAGHKFMIVDARDKYRTRQKLKYPDGVIVEDSGIAYEGGHCEWDVSNVTPNKDLILIMRMDYVHGDWEAEMVVNGKKVGNWACTGEDRKFRWRNMPFKVPAEYVTDTFLHFKQVPVKGERDINMFKLWFYQPA